MLFLKKIGLNINYLIFFVDKNFKNTLSVFYLILQIYNFIKKLKKNNIK